MNAVKYTLPHAALFDWDATLANTYALMEAAHNHVLASLNMPARPSGWLKPIFGATREDSYKLIYGESTPEIDALFMAYVQARHVEETKPMPGAEKLLQFFKDRAIPMAVVTNKRPPLVNEEIEAFGWAHYFDAVVGAGEASANKPSAAPLFLALDRLNYTGDIQNLWFFGDSVTDQKAAQEGSFPLLAYHDGSMPPLDHRVYPPLITIASYDAFLADLLGS